MIDYGFNFRILPDNVQTVTTVFNSKITAITHLVPQIHYVRIDILDESIEKINEAAEFAYKNKKLEGKQYTYGNINREV